LAQGGDLSLARIEAKAAPAGKASNSFDAIAAELAEKKLLDGKSPVTLKKFDRLLSFARPALTVPLGETFCAAFNRQPSARLSPDQVGRFGVIPADSARRGA